MHRHPAGTGIGLRTEPMEMPSRVSLRVWVPCSSRPRAAGRSVQDLPLCAKSYGAGHSRDPTVRPVDGPRRGRSGQRLSTDGVQRGLREMGPAANGICAVLV